MPIKFMLDSGAAVSVVNHNIVKHIPITSIETRAVSANGSPLDVTGQMNADVLQGDFAANQKFIAARNLAVDCLTWSKSLAHTRCDIRLWQYHFIIWGYY